MPTATPTRSRSPRRARTNQPKRILNCLPSRDTERDWNLDAAREAGLVTAKAAIPPSVDRRAAWWTVGDQKSTGSCVGWATADSVLRWHLVAANRLPRNKRLAVRFTWMAAKETDQWPTPPTTFIEEDGTSLKAALKVSRDYGAVPETALPFANGTLWTGTIGAFYTLAAQNRLAAYFNLGTDVQRWRRWIATNGPILTRLTVDPTWWQATANQGRLDAYDAANAEGGHAVALVGYTPDRFIVRNSWGTGWGDKGFAYASDAYAAAAFSEAYGITV